MPTYSYAKKDGSIGTTADKANAPDIAANSGFIEGAIAPKDLKRPKVVALPGTPKTPDYSSPSAGTTSMMEQNAATLKKAEPQQADDLTGLFDKYLKASEAPPSSEAIYSDLYGKSGIGTAQEDLAKKQQAVRAAQGELDAVSARIQGIAAEGESMNLQQEGRQAPMSVIRGSQAENDRKTAIRALPLQIQALAAQAKVASAQGDAELSRGILQQAETQLNTLFSLKVQDATAQHAYRGKLVDAVYGFATEQEKRRLDDVRHKDDQAFQLQLKNLDFEREKELAVFKAGLEAPAPGSPLLLAQNEQGIQDVGTLLSDKALNSSVGPLGFLRGGIDLPFGLRLPTSTSELTGAKSNFIAGVEQLRSQLSLDSLVNAKSNGATFGALSEGELRLLQESGSKLSSWAIKDKNGNVTGYKANEKDFKNELQKVNNFKTLDYILKGGDPATVGAIVQPDGTVWVERWDGAFTQVY